MSETLRADLIRARDLLTAWQCDRVGWSRDYTHKEWSEKVAVLLPNLIEAAKSAKQKPLEVLND